MEKNDEVGGGVTTQQVTLPVFRHDLHSIMHSVVRANPLISLDELGLRSRYGLEYIVPDAQIATPFRDGSSIVIYRDIERSCESIERYAKPLRTPRSQASELRRCVWKPEFRISLIGKLSAKDAKAYREFAAWGQKVYVLLASSGLFQRMRSFSQVVSDLEGSPEGREALGLLQASTFELLDSWFEHDGLKAMIAKFTSEWLLGPDEPGTALSALMRHMGNHVIGSGYPKGGSGELARALRDCVHDTGGTIITGCRAERISVENGRRCRSLNARRAGGINTEPERTSSRREPEAGKDRRRSFARRDAVSARRREMVRWSQEQACS